MSVSIRSYLQNFVLDDFIEECHRYTSLGQDPLKDAALEILAAMLSEEQRFEGAFENQRAFLGYVRKSMIRHVIATQNAETRKENSLERGWLHQEVKTPEEQVLAALEYQSFSEIVQTVMKKAQLSEGLLSEGKELIDLILSEPDLYIQRRQSGQNQGALVFNYIELTRELGWNKQRVYDRLERIRKVFLKELKPLEEKS